MGELALPGIAKLLKDNKRLQRESAELRECVEWWERKCGRIETKLAAAEGARRDLDALQFIGDVISVDHALASQGKRDFYRFDISRSLLETWQRLERAAIDAAKTEAKA